jgi:hypothetical protein
MSSGTKVWSVENLAMEITHIPTVASETDTLDKIRCGSTIFCVIYMDKSTLAFISVCRILTSIQDVVQEKQLPTYQILVLFELDLKIATDDRENA